MIASLLSRLSSDFWPPDRSFVGPNILASAVQAVIVVAVLSFLYPPLKAWIKSEFGRLHDKLDTHHTAIIEQAERHHAEHMAKLDAVQSPKTPGRQGAGTKQTR